MYTSFAIVRTCLQYSCRVLPCGVGACEAPDKTGFKGRALWRRDRAVDDVWSEDASMFESRREKEKKVRVRVRLFRLLRA